MLKQAMKRTLILLACIVIASGCATVGRKLDENTVASIRKGETTRDQVLKLLGSPEQVSRNADGEVTFQYLYSRATAKPETFIPFVGMIAGGANVQSQNVVVTFRPDGIVKDVVSTYGATETGIGASAAGKARMQEVEGNKRSK